MLTSGRKLEKDLRAEFAPDKALSDEHNGDIWSRKATTDGTYSAGKNTSWLSEGSMGQHPGGDEHTLRMISLAKLPAGARILDLGAGEGEAVKLLRGLGYAAEGLDLKPGGPDVRQGNLLYAPWPDGSFDAILSQCAFFLSGDLPGAWREAYRLLKPGGAMLFSDVCFEAPEPLAEAAGFRVETAEDCTAAWREYYLESLWRGTAECCGIRGKCEYKLLICRKD